MSSEKMEEEIKKPTRDKLIGMLDDMIAKIDEMPTYAMTSPVTHYDHASLLILLSAILKS